ncbi:DNA glycosylase/AP lyase ROS1-like [Rutidosis leptorrhynchoides]|uniref:DNA glycosylase/AP lyase ROS1-like n=1 Tax=Rutidosis leptorrhynchoides TaxID=125765 RepID=UPI003A9A52D7
MNFERDFEIPHNNRNSWRPVIQGIPISHENGNEQTHGYMNTITGGNRIVGGTDPTLDSKRAMPTQDRTTSSQDSCTTINYGNSCSSPMERILLQGNTISENRNDWILRRNGISTNKTVENGNRNGPSMTSSWTPLTLEKLINEKSNPRPVDIQENRVKTESWQDLLGMYSGLLQEETVDTNKILKDLNPKQPPTVHNNKNQSWVASPSSNRNQNSNKALNFMSTDPANWKSSDLATIMGSSSNATCVSRIPKNGVRDSRLKISSKLPTQVESSIMRTTSSTSTVKSHLAQRSISNNSNSPKDGSPSTYRHGYNRGSPPTLNPDAAASNLNDSSSFAPITPYNQRKHDSRWVVDQVNIRAEEISTPVTNSNDTQSTSIKDADNIFGELLQTIGESPPSAISTTQNDHIISNEGDEHVIDLNQTPQQKTPNRRKKHRPRVIREGKPKRTRKSKGPTNGSSGEVRVKRKYVRKNGVTTPNEHARVKRNYVRKNNVDQLKSKPSSVVETPNKSCKKKLDFDLERAPHDQSYENISSQHERNVDVISQELQQNTWLNRDNQVNKHVGIKDNVVQASTMPIYVQGTPHSYASESMRTLDERRGIKRQNSNANVTNFLSRYQKLLLGVAHRSYDRNNLSSILFENHKKMKMQGEYQAIEDNSRHVNGVYRNGSAMQLLNYHGRVNQSYTVVNGGHHHFRPPMAARHYLLKQQVLSRMQANMMRAQNYTQGAAINWKPMPNGDYRYAITTYPATLLEKMQNAEPKLSNQRLDGLSQNLLQHHKTPLNGYQQASTIARGRPRKPKAELSVETITDMLEDLHIYDGNKKQQNKLVLYRGSDAMIPFEPIKKRVPRPKVDLDDETERVWRQLMGIEGSEGAETTGKDKEKWWEDERRVFRGRADSFIARMHLVQGDRRFSRWKGSVVDSVIGVFLTQNVSDHLSSSAFMALAARFPLKSTSNTKVCCQDIAHDEPYDVTEPIDIIEYTESTKDEVLETDVNLSQESIDSSTIQTVDEFRSSSGSNSEAEVITTSFETRKQSGPPQNLVQDEKLPMFGGIPIIFEDSNSGVDKQYSFENTVTEASSTEKKASREPPSEPGPNSSKGEKVTAADERKQSIDWDSLRKEALLNGKHNERNKDAADSLDYEALRCSHVNEISDAIRERGMNNLLADRMKDFLNRLVRDHGSIDLEWLRDAPPDKAKDYLLSFRGLGLKSVECVRLLTLHHLAFPVDTNVGRIAVRLGWVPLQPLPESLQLHLLEMYPILESIQKYLWPRLCKLDQLTLYELHYQMITFGKVFCTKSKPNCNACPMRAECRHFASAFASARLALPGPEEKRIVTSDAPVATDPDPIPPTSNMPMPPPLPLPPPENKFNTNKKNYEPIIEVPSTPEPEPAEITISDIEDQYYGDDSDEIPSIKLNMEEFTSNLQNIIQDSKELQENMSKALVALNPNAASIPTPKLKDVSRLRTEHLVYELPDSHPLLEGWDKREPDDPSHYLLAIWTPGETANSVQPPETECAAQQSGQLCDRATCFSCNNVKEANSQVVRGTILIPCRTAMRGSFPLNGTYFQVNEMFADHASSLNPIDVPRAWIWNLPRRKVYFGTSVTTIFKGLSTGGIQYCFWKGFVCVRGFDRIKRVPRPLMARLHFSASKLIAQKTNANK